MEAGPKRLSMRQEGKEPRDERGRPQVDSRPPIWHKLGGGGKRPSMGMQHGKYVDEEKASIGCYLQE